VGGCDFQRRKLAAVCGRYCGTCDAYQGGLCCGCGYQLGCTPRGECVIFRCCVAEQGLAHCGLCPDLPCQVFLSHSTPLDVARHYRALRRRVKIGTDTWLDEAEKQL
jgi:hypothetical protein